MKTRVFLYLSILSLLYSCVGSEESDLLLKANLEGQKEQIGVKIKNGNWLGNLIIDSNNTIPFNFTILDDSIFIYNGLEKISTSYSLLKGNDFLLEMPVFNSKFIFSTNIDGLFGNWHNYAKGEGYKLEFFATYQDKESYRFNVGKTPFVNISGKWEVAFSPGSDNQTMAIGLFDQKNNALTGTFITETGDYRFLQGNVKRDSLFLSCFDGSHAFLFKGVQKNDSIHGMFFSGNHCQESWIAVKNKNFILSNPYSITTLNEEEKISFCFPDLDSILVSYPSSKYENKVVIIQIIGSWCPNCLDESAYLTTLYNKYNEQGLEIISLAYEIPELFYEKCIGVKKLKRHFNADYDFLIAGDANKKEVEKTLPFLKNMASFPTTIFIDKSGVVKKIHSGFYGPSTGPYYIQYKDEIDLLIKRMINDEIFQ